MLFLPIAIPGLRTPRASWKTHFAFEWAGPHSLFVALEEQFFFVPRRRPILRGIVI
jgi:hypothetical protein